MNNKVAIVTGGSTGLGEQMAIGLAEAGADLVISARKVQALEATARRLDKFGVKVLTARCDVGNQEDVNNLVQKTLDNFGRIDILVNNAGITWGSPVEDFPLDKWQQVMQTNVTGVFLCSQAVGRVMISQQRGKIINIASVEGFVGGHPEYMHAIAYNTSKGAVINLTRDLAGKWAQHNINVNAIAPGWFHSRMVNELFEKQGDAILKAIPMGRFGGEDDLKGAVVYLASNASNYVTGHILSVDGGFLVW